MTKKKRMLVAVTALLALALLAAACGDDNESQLPNPASVYCEEHGGTLEIRTAADGSQSGFCVFDDGSECEEFAYMNGECQPGDSLGGESEMANPASVFCEEHGGTVEIRDEAGGQVGYCVFDDGSECEEWAYMNGECSPGQASGEAVIGGDTQLPNPAAVFCEEQGGTSEIVTAADGSQSGVCHFPDGSTCDEWAFFREECAPGN